MSNKILHVFITIVTMLILTESLLMATTKKHLKTYREKRDFSATPEPHPSIHSRSKSSATRGERGVVKSSIFVVQKHSASHLHYDFRIEINDVLKSWAVPKGISTNPTEKHLAIQTEDHPMEYAKFHGIIPKGNYGAGTVEIWDSGTFENIKEKDGKLVPMKKCLEMGRVEICLQGKKLKGNYALIKTKFREGKDSWLIFKMRDGKTPKHSSARTLRAHSKEKEFVKIGKHQIELTNQDKILFPEGKITKGQLIAYYKNIAPIMLTHMKNRAVTMHRFPDGITKEGFYQKDISDYFPNWIKSIKIKKQDGTNKYVVCNDAATLVYLANQACITPHLWLSKINKLDYPDRMIFDLDPGAKTSFDTIKQAALTLRDILKQVGVTAFVMTTGSRGLHVVVPLNRKADFDGVRAFARDVADVLVAQDPKKFTTEIRLNKRMGRLFIDTTRNAFAQTTVAPYAVRARPGAPVATPLEWSELNDKKLTSNKYTIKTIAKRLEKMSDPWKNIGKKTYGLSLARKKLDKRFIDLQPEKYHSQQ